MIFWGAVLGEAFLGLGEDDEKVLVDNKCQCVKMTSRFVPSKEDPEQEVLERNIRIIVPLTARENISDPSSPVRTRFVYKLSKLCKNCDQEEGNQKVPAGKSTMCNDPDVPCYTYDRNRCYTSPSLFSHAGKTTTVETALNPDSCYPD